MRFQYLIYGLYLVHSLVHTVDCDRKGSGGVPGSIHKAPPPSHEGGAEPESTLKKYQTLMDQLEAFCDDKGIRFVQELGQDEVLEFRRSWEDPNAGYKLTRLKKNGKPLWTTKSIGTAKRDARTLTYFFDRCIARKWITENPTSVLNFPKSKKGRVKTDINLSYAL